METSVSVAVIKSHFLQVFNCTTETWAAKVQLLQQIQTDDTSATISLPDGSFFTSGGNAVSDAWNSAYRLTSTGSVERLSELLSPRGHHGVVLFQGAVFVFGGRYYGELLTDAEKLILDPIDTLGTRQWVRLPYMPTERAFFQPCASDHFIFLCGGGAHTVETFDPISQQYAGLPFTLPESSRNHISVLQEGVLVVISQHSLTRWSGTAVSQKHDVWPDVWGNFSAVLVGEVVYTVKGEVVLKVNLATLVQEKIGISQ